MNSLWAAEYAICDLRSWKHAVIVHNLSANHFTSVCQLVTCTSPFPMCDVLCIFKTDQAKVQQMKLLWKEPWNTISQHSWYTNSQTSQLFHTCEWIGTVCRILHKLSSHVNDKSTRLRMYFTQVPAQARWHFLIQDRVKILHAQGSQYQPKQGLSPCAAKHPHPLCA